MEKGGCGGSLLCQVQGCRRGIDTDVRRALVGNERGERASSTPELDDVRPTTPAPDDSREDGVGSVVNLSSLPRDPIERFVGFAVCLLSAITGRCKNAGAVVCLEQGHGFYVCGQLGGLDSLQDVSRNPGSRRIAISRHQRLTATTICTGASFALRSITNESVAIDARRLIQR